MNELLRLGSRQRRGSKPRCHWLTHGTKHDVACRLTTLVAPWATVAATDRWMPEGFDVCTEAQLHKADRLIDSDLRNQLSQWWLPSNRSEARTPNFDIASTCTIEGLPGLLLIEAKAHDEELIKEESGRALEGNASEDRRASHLTIGDAIRSANEGLGRATSVPWNISRDSHYQMSNRFAWTWRLTEAGVPVVLVYLAFPMLAR